jgi:hypothetical protein
MNVRRSTICLITTLAICLVLASMSPLAMAEVIVKTEDGPVKGLATATMDEFLGVPYAAQPIGKLRWMPPQPHGKWKGVFDATLGRHSCIQSDGAGGTTGIEDCLFVNIFRSNHKNQNGQRGRRDEGDRQDNGLPVMVWIHVGAWCREALICMTRHRCCNTEMCSSSPSTIALVCSGSLHILLSTRKGISTVTMA